MSKYLSLFLLIFNCVFASAQEQAIAEPKEELNNSIFGTFGYTYVREGEEIGETDVTGIYIPTIGIDYYYRIVPKLKIGLMMDLELADYLIVSKNIERNKAFIATAIAAYSLPKKFAAYGGLGIELEEHKNLAVFRLGVEHELELKKEWALATGIFYDFKESYDTWTFSLALGKSF